MVRAIVQSLKIATIAATALVMLAGSVRVFDYAVERSAPDDAGQRVAVTIAEGASTAAVADQLAEAGLIRSTFLFSTQMRLDGGRFVAGKHSLRKGMTVEQIVGRITGAEVAADEGGEDEEGEGDLFEITIPEGWRTEQIAEEAETGGLEGGYDAFLAATQQVNLDPYDFLQDPARGDSLEGYLFPATYDFVTDDPAYNVQRMLDTFDERFTPEMRDKAAEMGISIHEVVTIASLVEREAQKDDERPIIADIYLKRWREAQDGWKLEADPTVQYVIGERGDWWPSPLTDEQLHVDDAYNTYANAGLPPGPICNPGSESIQAVLFAEPTPYYFFVAKGDTGEHAFAATKAEQDTNVEQYQGGDG